MSTETNPLVSVIIPMFNSAKFISQGLESLLYQTMKNFEVVVIDDCSTDNSVEVVESFKPRFNTMGGGHNLHVIKLAKNTGAPGVPRNVGIQSARGKYIAFLDSDDLFTKTALEELTTLAEKFQAEVVHTDGVFTLWGGKAKSEDDIAMTDMNELTNPKNFTALYGRKKKLLAPILETDDVAKRVHKWLNPPAYGFWSTVLHFYRRDFLIDNQIVFADMVVCEDMPFALEALCLAKRYLITPNVTYIRRRRIGSATKNQLAPEKAFLTRMHAVNCGFNEFKRILMKLPALENLPDYRYNMLDWFMKQRIGATKGFYSRQPEFKLYEWIKSEFYADDDHAFAAYLFNKASLYLNRTQELEAEIKKLREEIVELKKSLEQR